MKAIPLVLLALLLLNGCDTPKPSTTEVVIKFVDADREPVKDVEVSWARRLGSRSAEKDGPFATDKKGQVFLPRRTVNSKHNDRYEIRYRHPSYYPGSVFYYADGTSTQFTDSDESSSRVRPFIRGTYVVELTERAN